MRLGLGVVRAGEIGRAADRVGQRGVDHLEHFLARLARGPRRLVGRHLGLEGVDDIVDRRRDVAGLAAIELGAVGFGHRCMPLDPLAPRRLAPGAGLAPGGEDRLGNLEGRIRPAEVLAGARDLGLAERRAVRFLGAGLGRRAIADDGLAGDHRRLVGDLLRLADGARDGVLVEAVDGLHVPAGGGEALEMVFRRRQRRRAIDRDAVVVEQHDQAAEAEVTGQRDGLLADAFHEAAVAGDHVGEVVDDIGAETRREKTFGEREADRVADALAERAGGRLDAGGVAVFGMARGLGAELAEILQVIQRHVRIAGEIKQRIQQHRAVAGRQDEAIAVGPMRLLRIELQEFGEQNRGDVGHAHRHTGMAEVRLFDRIHGQGPDGIRHVAARRFVQSFLSVRRGFFEWRAT